MENQIITIPNDAKVSSVNIDNTEKTVTIVYEPQYKAGDFCTTRKGGIFIYSHGSTVFAYCFMLYNAKSNNRYYGEQVACGMCDIKGLATESEKQTLLDALKADGKQWNAEKMCVEPLRCRGEKSEPYFYVGSRGECLTNHDVRDGLDNRYFEMGNYFQTEQQTQQAAKELVSFFAKYK